MLLAETESLALAYTVVPRTSARVHDTCTLVLDKLPITKTVLPVQGHGKARLSLSRQLSCSVNSVPSVTALVVIREHRRRNGATFHGGRIDSGSALDNMETSYRTSLGIMETQ